MSEREKILPDLNRRIKSVIDKYSKGSVKAFSDTLENVSQQRLNRIFIPDTRTGKIPSVPDDIIMGIANSYPQIRLEWLITGKGSMEKDGETNIVTHDYADEYFRGGSPFYSELPVSAGESGELIPAEEVPSGYIKIPGISPLAYFPVVGFSMKPEINPGDVIGVVTVNSWDRVDPDKTYMIITHEERMIKHLRVDNEREDILWCFSPNYKDFILPKEDIRAIYHVVFAGRLM